MDEEKIDKIDQKFDKAEKVWDRFQKLLLKILGGIVGISLAIYVAYDQLKDKHDETIGRRNIEHIETNVKYIDSVIIEKRPTITKSQTVQNTKVDDIIVDDTITKSQTVQNTIVDDTIVDDTIENNWVIVKETYSIDKEGYRKGDTIYIDYYSDGYIEKYYTDGEDYYE